MDIPLSQDRLLSEIEEAIGQRDIHRVRELAPKINWVHQYRRDLLASLEDDAQYQRNALLPLFMVDNYERVDVNKREGDTQWKAFCKDALGVMVKHGFRLLDDTYYLELMTEQTDLLPIIAKICHTKGLRGDAGETTLHLATHCIPFPNVVKASYCKGMDINARDDQGRTPFHRLWEEEPPEDQMDEWLESAHFMLSKGANPQLLDGEGVSGLQAMMQFIEKVGNLQDARDLMHLHQTLQSHCQAHELDANSAQAPKPAQRRSSL